VTENCWFFAAKAQELKGGKNCQTFSLLISKVYGSTEPNFVIDTIYDFFSLGTIHILSNQEFGFFVPHPPSPIFLPTQTIHPYWLLNIWMVPYLENTSSHFEAPKISFDLCQAEAFHFILRILFVLRL